MRIDANSPEEYLEKVPEERKEVMKKLRELILENLPEHFEEQMSYGMIGYVVPHSYYPPGYHVTPELPLPFVNLASQKNHIALYHACLYSMPELLKWFQKEYAKRVDTKLDMGKSCIRFRNPKKIPLELIAELMTRVSADEWISHYEKQLSRK